MPEGLPYVTDCKPEEEDREDDTSSEGGTVAEGGGDVGVVGETVGGFLHVSIVVDEDLDGMYSDMSIYRDGYGLDSWEVKCT